MSFEGFKGSVEVSSGLVGPNGRDIPLMHSGSVQVGSDPKIRLSAVLDGMQERIDESLVQSDWNETDENSLSFIKNKPEIVMDEEIIEMLAQEDMLPAVADADGSLLSDENNNVLLW